MDDIIFPQASVQDPIQLTSDTSKECEKDARREEKESINIRKEKLDLQKVITNKSIRMKTAESEDSKSLKAKPMQDNRSGNSRRLKKTGAVVQPLGSDKSECKLLYGLLPQVQNIVVIGHNRCGGIKGLMDVTEDGEHTT